MSDFPNHGRARLYNSWQVLGGNVKAYLLGIFTNKNKNNIRARLNKETENFFSLCLILGRARYNFAYTHFIK